MTFIFVTLVSSEELNSSECLLTHLCRGLMLVRTPVCGLGFLIVWWLCSKAERKDVGGPYISVFIAYFGNRVSLALGIYFLVEKSAYRLSLLVQWFKTPPVTPAFILQY